jgi:hypothetical protein
MLPKKLFVIDHRSDTPGRQLSRAVVIAEDADSALGQLQVYFSTRNQRRKPDWPYTVFLRSKARVLLLSNSALTPPIDAEYGVISVETSEAASSEMTASAAARKD